ncbi:MAG: FUSC family protein [Acidimicrobiales bacterium]
MIARVGRRIALTPDIRLSLRAAFCISLPLIIGLIVHQRLYATLAGIGALWAISQDGLDDWHDRGPRLVWVAVAGGAGVALGAVVVDHDSATWVLVLALGLVALVAGFIEASNHATAGAYLLIGTVLGVGLGFRGRVWQSTLALVIGALFVYVVALLMNREFRVFSQRIYLAHAFDALAVVTESIGTPGFYAVRERAVTTLDQAHDVVGAIHLETSNNEIRSLYQCLVVALRCGEAISYLEGKGIVVSPTVAKDLRRVARTLEDDGALAAVATLSAVRDDFAATPELNALVASVFEVELATVQPRAIRRSTTRVLLSLPERLRFGVILAVAVAVAMILSRVLDGPHGFWLPFAVAFILRPDVGPVISRAVARTIGTVLGVGIAAFVAWTGNTVLELIVLSCIMAAIQPWAKRRSHLLAVMTFTPIVFVFLGLIGAGKGLFGARIIDTALGAAIVLVLDVLLWTTAPSLRPAEQLAAARAASARYGKEATIDDPVLRHQLRRSALRAVTNARSAISNARSEPRLLRRFDPSSAAQLDEVERSIDAHTVALLETSDPTAP